MFLFNAPASPDVYTLSLHDVLPIFGIVLAFLYTGNLSSPLLVAGAAASGVATVALVEALQRTRLVKEDAAIGLGDGDRKSTRLNSSHLGISYDVFCLKKTITCNRYC